MTYILVIISGLIALVSSVALILYSKWDANPANRCEVINNRVYCDKVPYTGNIKVNDKSYIWVYMFYNGVIGAVSMQMSDGAQATYITPNFNLWRITNNYGQPIDSRLFQELYKVQIKENAVDALVLLVEKYKKFHDIVY